MATAVTAKNDANIVTVTLDGNTAGITAGGGGSSGSITLDDGSGKRLVQIRCSVPSAVGQSAAVASSAIAQIAGSPPAPAENVVIDGYSGALYLSNGTATSPTVVVSGSGSWLRLSNGKTQIHLDGVKSTAQLSDDSGKLRVSLEGQTSVVRLADDTGTDRIVCNGETGVLGFRSEKGQNRILLDSERTYVAFGGSGHDAGLALFPQAAPGLEDWAQATFTLNAQAAAMAIGGSKSTKGVSGSIAILDANANRSIFLDASSGDITLLNADCAEDFDLADEEDRDIEPGTVMVLDEDGRIRRSSDPYDSRVAGVLSGAGGFRPGLVLDRRIANNVRRPVALMGKVFCKVDAQYGPIRAGDLLTTSSTPGHAMKMLDRSRALGSVLGKALRPVRTGQSLIPILVTLQ